VSLYGKFSSKPTHENFCVNFCVSEYMCFCLCSGVLCFARNSQKLALKSLYMVNSIPSKLYNLLVNFCRVSCFCKTLALQGVCSCAESAHTPHLRQTSHTCAHTHKHTHKHTHTCTHTHTHTIFLERSPRDACSLRRGADRAHKLRRGGKSHIHTNTQTHTHKHMHARTHTHAYTRTHLFF